MEIPFFILTYFLGVYKSFTGREHPGLAPIEKERILSEIEEIFEMFYHDLETAVPKIIYQFFIDWRDGKIRGEDPTIWLFITPQIWKMSAFKTHYLEASEIFRKDGPPKEYFGCEE